jgi:hypothetical protein
MPEGTITTIVVVVAILVVAAAAALVWQRRRLQKRFGPEYDRAVDERDSRLAAEGELLAREQRHRRLEIRPLPEEAREQYMNDWRRVQEGFVDTPGDAVVDADRLVTALLADRGYATEGYERQAEDLSVEHAQVLDHYRAAHETSERQARHEATTEDLRGAMVHYRAVFDELLETGRPDETPHHHRSGRLRGRR